MDNMIEMAYDGLVCRIAVTKGNSTTITLTFDEDGNWTGYKKVEEGSADAKEL